MMEMMGSFYRVPKALEIFWVMETSIVLMKQFLVGSWIASGWGLVIRKTKPRLEMCNFQLLGRGETLEFELIFNHAFLMRLQ